MRRKIAQQEIIGFVLIIVLVVIIVLVFIGLSINKSSTAVTQNDIQVSNFLQASLQITTNCKLSGQYASMRDVVKVCYRNENCDNDVNACLLLNSTLRGIMKTEIGADKPTEAYTLRIYLDKSGGNPESEILKMSDGNCTKNTNHAAAREAINTANGNIILELEWCYIKTG